LSVIKLETPVLRASVSDKGIRFGALDAFGGGPARPLKLPSFALDVTEGTLEAATPLGPIRADFEGAGRLDRDFSGSLLLAQQSGSGPDGRFGGLSGRIEALTTADGPRIVLNLKADDLAAYGLTLGGLRLVGDARAQTDFATPAFNLRLEGDAAAGLAEEVVATLTGGADQLGPGGAPQAWSLSAQVETPRLTGPLDGALTFAADLKQEGATGRGGWRVNGRNFGAGGAAGALTGGGAASLADGGLFADGGLTWSEVSVSREGKKAFLGVIPSLGGLPPAPLMADARAALTRAMDAFTAQTRFSLAGGALSVERATIESASGAKLTATGDGAALARWGRDGLAASGRLQLEGRGLPPAQLRLNQVRAYGDEGFALRGALDIAGWRTEGAALDLTGGSFIVDTRSRQLAIDGALTVSGPLGALAVRNLALPLDLSGTIGSQFRIAPQQGCAPARFSAIEGLGYRFGGGALRICPAQTGFVTIDAGGRIGGGFSIGALALSGVDEKGAAASLAAERTTGRLSGTASASRLDIDVNDVIFRQLLGADRTISVRAEAVTAAARFDRSGWRVDGDFAGADVDDPGLPSTVVDFAGRWSATPEGEAVIIGFEDAAGSVRDKTSPARFEPLRVAQTRGELRDGVVTAAGAIRLAENDAPLATFEARHDVAALSGEATVITRDLTFSPLLELEQVTALARGVAANVRGPLDADIVARWQGEKSAASGHVDIKGVSFAAAFGPIEGVRGRINLDDAFALTSPPGQTLTVDAVNPGLRAENGTVRFQLKRDGAIGLESVRFPIAGGALDVEPVDIVIGAEETRYNVKLKDADISTVMKALGIKDLESTVGTFEGTFPLVVTPTAARIEDGRLRAAPGGLIVYTGAVGKNDEGPLGLAFAALRSFRYDNLELVLNGELGGDIVAGIKFSGFNEEAVNLAATAIGLQPVKRLPFRFNVTIQAPTKAIAKGTATITDPRVIIREAAEGQPSVDVTKVP
jgi:hypothetical protein